jgi:hypothetical protein
VPTKIVLKVGLFERDFECDHLAEKSNWTKMGQKIHCAMVKLLYINCGPKSGRLVAASANSKTRNSFLKNEAIFNLVLVAQTAFLAMLH